MGPVCMSTLPFANLHDVTNAPWPAISLYAICHFGNRALWGRVLASVSRSVLVHYRPSGHKGVLSTPICLSCPHVQMQGAQHAFICTTTLVRLMNDAKSGFGHKGGVFCLQNMVLAGCHLRCVYEYQFE